LCKNRLKDSIIVDATINKTESIIINNNINFNLDNSILGNSITNHTRCYQYKHKIIHSTYIDSAFNINVRHKDQIRANKSKFQKFIISNGDLFSFSLGYIYFSPNFVREFKSLNCYYKLSKGEIIFLTHITELISKILEQSLITGSSPNFKSAFNVVFTYNNWNID
jgi:hypothetical protein